MNLSPTSEAHIEKIEHQCKQSLELFSELVDQFLLESKLKRQDCMAAVTKLWDSQGSDKPEKGVELLHLHLGMVMTTILSAEEALKDQQLDLCIRLLTTIALEYGFAYTFLDEKIAFSRVMTEKGFLRASRNPEAAKKKDAISNIKEEVSKNLDKFSQRGFTKQFNFEMSEKYPELSLKTIEKHVSIAKKDKDI